MENPLVCSHCFKNVGLRRAAAKFGTGSDTSCPFCCLQGGIKLDKRAVEELFRDFYCHGSQTAMYLPRVFTEGDSDADIQLERSAGVDYELLKKLAGLSIRRHTPRLYELGFTEIRSDIDDVLQQDPASASEEAAEKLRDAFRKLLECGFEYEMQEGERIYRARISPNNPLEDSEYDSPPSTKATANRIATAGERILCGAFNIQTCLAEIKPDIDELIHHKIFVASLKAVSNLKLIDFTERPEQPRSPELRMTLGAFFEANQRSYHLTQFLSRFARKQQYDGIIYPSAMECTAAHKGTWKNIALFGAPISDKKLLVESVNRVLVRSVTQDFDLGPAWRDDTDGNHLALYLKGWTKRVRAEYK